MRLRVESDVIFEKYNVCAGNAVGYQLKKCNHVQLCPFEVNFSPKNVNFTKSIVQPTSNFECRVSEIGKKPKPVVQIPKLYQFYSFSRRK